MNGVLALLRHRDMRGVTKIFFESFAVCLMMFFAEYA